MKDTPGDARDKAAGFHEATLKIHEVGLNQNYYTFASMLQIQIGLLCD